MPILRKTLATAVLVSAILTGSSVAQARQKVAELARYNDWIAADARTLSPTELSLAELQREREELLRGRSKESPRIFKNKLTILNNKIDFLEDQLRRMRPDMVKQRLVPLKDKAPMRFVAWRNAAPQEARLSSPQTLPIHVGAKPASKVDSRESSQRLPIPAQMTNALPNPERAPLESGDQPKGKMPKTGAEWKTMSRPDKEIYILSVMANLSRRDVYLMKPYGFYIQNIDDAITKNPQFEQEYVHRILMLTAYESEPDMRKDLEKVW